jgi:hypothetical protein
MPLDKHLAQRGDKYDIHLLLYAKQLRIIDEAATKFGVSRATIVEALADAYAVGELEPEPHLKSGPGRRASRAAKQPARLPHDNEGNSD